jgi:hypothetical protein
VLHKWFIVLFGILVGSQVLAAGQIPAPQIVPVQKLDAQVISVFSAKSIPLSASSFLLSQDRENSLAHSSLRFPGPYDHDHELEGLSPIRKDKTVIFTQLSLPLVQLWDGKLQLEAFQSTLRIQNGQFGASGFPGGSRSVHLAGISLNFHFGRGERTRRPMQAWRSVPRIVAVLLN